MTKVYKCKKCGKNYSFWDGIGFAYPTVCCETYEKINNGDYGEEIRDSIKEHPGLAVDCSRKLYVCGNCGYWSNEQALDTYVPNKMETSKDHGTWSTAMPFGGLDPSEYNSVKVVLPVELKVKYTLLKRFTHRCPVCKEALNQCAKIPVAGSKFGAEILGIKCKECGGEIVSTEEEICID